MSAAISMMAGFYSTTGQQIGIALNGYLYIPYAKGGIVMQDSSGANWLLQIATDGSLTTDAFTP